ncbi:hypothetical protein ACEQUB_01596 [Ralstonia syzygii]
MRQRDRRHGFAGDAPGQRPGRIDADLPVRLRHRRQRRRQPLADRQAIEADHAEVFRHAQAARAQCADGQQGQPVIAAEHGGGSRRCQQAVQLGRRHGLCVEVDLDRRLRDDAGRFQRIAVAGVAQRGPVGGGQRAGQHADPPVPVRQQRADRIARGGTVVDRHAAAHGKARLPLRVVVGQHVRHALGVQAVQVGVGGGIGHRQDQAVDALLQHGLDGAGLALAVIGGGHQHHALAGRRRGLIDALHAFGEHGVGQ